MTEAPLSHVARNGFNLDFLGYSLWWEMEAGTKAVSCTVSPPAGPKRCSSSTSSSSKNCTSHSRSSSHVVFCVVVPVLSDP